MAGRKRKPTKLKLLQGTQRADRLNPDEPNPETVIPSPPEHLSQTAKEEWDRISHELETLGLISEGSMAALAAYCDVYAEYIEVSALLAEMEETGNVLSKYITKTKSGNLIQNPLIGIRHTAFKLMKDFMTEFGITPASQQKVSGKKKDDGKKKSPFSKQA